MDKKRDRYEKRAKRINTSTAWPSKWRDRAMEKLAFYPMATGMIVDVDWPVPIWPCRGGIYPDKV